MDDQKYQLFQAALGAMGDNETAMGPRPLIELCSQLAPIHGVDFGTEDSELLWASIFAEDPNASARLKFGQSIRRWDRLGAPEWSEGADPFTVERRALICQLLAIPRSWDNTCADLFPLAKPPSLPIVIAETHKDWYSPERQDLHHYYWSSFSKYLGDSAGWAPESVEDLNEAATSIVERLSDPERPDIYATKGLVVGYVQSGKTANFTAVTAKAADAGYRLIIILAGTLNVLRSQTQRRLDRELVGKELIELTAATEYEGDRDWPDKFVSYGVIPSEDGAFDWSRLTDSHNDYKRLDKGLPALDFKRTYSDRPFNSAENLHASEARLIVIKKNPQVLKRLNEDLMKLRIELEQVPALVIDDESDQASVNTLKPSAQDIKKRTATNGEIVNLLKILPRAQYIGYTATPFANVFVDPSDADDLFPKDYIVSLPRPVGYMGVRDFFDFAQDGGELAEDEKPQGFRSNERAFVRFVEGDDMEEKNLEKAILSFVLSGAIKLFRASKDMPVSITHHTMLVHKSVKQLAHEDDRRQVEAVYERLQKGSATFYSKLKELWKTDYAEVSQSQHAGVDSTAAYKPPTNFTVLKPFIDECINKIETDNTPVRIVNGDKKYEDDLPDFDRNSIWGILVGGTKLSRGYTVEGLTVSYYRRRIRQADTLMQVGRWFGFRRGYRDLVRLFVGTKEPDGKNSFFNLYQAFRAICKDEEAFRDELQRYSKMRDGRRILPREVPPLVPQHMIRPTAANKMYNSIITFKNFSGQRIEKGSTPENSKSQSSNANAFRKCVEGGVALGLKELKFSVDGGSTPKNVKANIWEVDKSALVDFLDAYIWNDNENLLQREREYLADKRDIGIKRVLLIAPQRKKDGGLATWPCAGMDLSVGQRGRITGRRFGAFSGSLERVMADYLAKVDSKLTGASKELDTLLKPGTAVMLCYPVVPNEFALQNIKEVGDSDISIGFGLRFPSNNITEELVHGVKDRSRESEVTI